MKERERFGALFAKERRRQGIPAEDIAKEVGASKNSVFNIEACAKRASPLMAILLAYQIEVTPHKRRQMLVAHATEVGLVDVSTLDEEALFKVVRLVERERERVASESLKKKRSQKSRRRQARRAR